MLHRVEAIDLPPTVECIVIHCGTNNLGKAKPADIVSGVLSIGVAARRKHCGKTPLEVIATGLLPCDIDGLCTRELVRSVNKDLRRRCKMLEGFTYMAQDEAP